MNKTKLKTTRAIKTGKNLNDSVKADQQLVTDKVKRGVVVVGLGSYEVARKRED